ncbi:putative late blight resistance proteinR1A-10 [Sesamum alatum]|uniref:Late blight resistance proteinR1A-10 n=1 Tax=Sesamum alatum TaxID=300844 RepID=A0AAE1YN91_9LAMI|nr:putative late blight resistance proteinR1A-10 [Sesamum alatum]
MAFAALVSLAQTLSQLLKQHQFPFFLEEKPRLRSLLKHVKFLQAFLEDFPEKAHHLEGRITYAANEAEDILEYLLFEEILSLDSSGGTPSFDVSPYRSRRSEAHRFQRKFQKQYQKLPGVADDVKSIVEEVMEIKSSLGVQDLKLSEFSPPTSAPMQLSDSSAPSSSSVLVPTKTDDKKDAMVGFEDDLMAIKTRLCGDSRKLEFVPIYGMGGIGKTTLARNAYEDQLIIQHFDRRAWLTVSQDYSVQEMLFTLVDSISAFNEMFDEEKHSYERMAVHVYKSLKGRRYLVVLDDIWSTKAWDDVRRIFPDDNNGSRIMLTTRLEDVAAYADSSCPLHKMHFMNADQSWDLLREKVFKQESCPPELENIGKMIARSCKGLPLAIIVIAGLLSTVSQTQASWEDIAKKVNSAVTANGEQIGKILSLSYSHLPHHLRPCFLYIGAFPEDYKIHVTRLVKLWVAEGFMKPSVSKSFEERAEEYLEDLVKRSLVLVTRRKCNGKIKYCSVHDLVRDLCKRKAREEKFLLHATDRVGDKILLESMKDQHRLSICPSSLTVPPSLTLLSNIYSPIIRTVLCFQNCLRFPSSLKSFRLLRVLDVVKLIVMEFPAQVLELFHLRYLAFTYGYQGDLYVPASISKLQNLQTLFILPYWWNDRDSSYTIHFPAEIWRLAQLRHLVSFMLDPLPSPCARSFALKNLQTLTLVANFKCAKRIGEIFPNLKKLGLIYNRDRVYWQVYHLHNLVHLHQLEKLKICIGSSCWGRQFPLWEKLAFPTTLKKLTLSGFVLSQQDMATIGSLPNLHVLQLRRCSFRGGKWETTEGEFSRLKFLQIESANLKHWLTESSHFPNLERLVLHGCRELGEIPDVIGEIPTLELIEVPRWPKSLMDSAIRIKEEQQESGNDLLQVWFG